MTKGPSPHLDWSEIDCHDGTPYPLEWRATRGRVVASVFERIRARLGELSGRLKPITIKSGYRTPSHNAAVGGAPNSLHLEGLALDLHTPSGTKLRHLIQAAHEVLTDRHGQPRGGVFIYDWGVHVDCRYYLKMPAARGDKRGK